MGFFCIAESKLDNDDVISFSDHTFYNYPRKQSYCRKSGGLGFFVRHTLAKYVDMIDSSSEYIAWIKISKIAHKLDKERNYTDIFPIYFIRTSFIDKAKVRLKRFFFITFYPRFYNSILAFHDSILDFYNSILAFLTRFFQLDTCFYYSILDFYNSVLAFYNSIPDFYNSKLTFLNSKLDTVKKNSSTSV